VGTLFERDKNVLSYVSYWLHMHTHTNTHTHTHKRTHTYAEREREREREIMYTLNDILRFLK
jgi:hypothetical protein